MAAQPDRQCSQVVGAVVPHVVDRPPLPARHVVPGAVGRSSATWSLSRPRPSQPPVVGLQDDRQAVVQRRHVVVGGHRVCGGLTKLTQPSLLIT